MNPCVYEFLMEKIAAYALSLDALRGANNGGIEVLPELISDFDNRIEVATAQKNGICAILHTLLPERVETESPLLVDNRTPVQFTVYENVGQNSGQAGSGLSALRLAWELYRGLHRWPLPAHPNLATGAILCAREERPIRVVLAAQGFNRLLVEFYINGTFTQAIAAN
jgi:hypothetical protein